MDALRGARVVTVGLACAVGGLLVADGGALFLVSARAVPVSVSNVVQRYRSHAVDVPTGATTAVAPVDTGTASPAGPTGIAAFGPHTEPGRIRTTGAAPRAATASVDAPQMPAPGVYVYATSGGEDVSAMGGSHHEYPARTTVTVTATPCGRELRWDALQGRWDDLSACVTGPEIDVAQYSTHHQFFGINDQRTYECPPGTVLRPAATAPGTSASGMCAGAGASTTVDSSVVGAEVVVVGGIPVPTVHVHVVQKLMGSTSGTRTSDIWFAADDGIIARMLTTVDGRSSTPVGESEYHEHLRLDLSSLVPLQ